LSFKETYGFFENIFQICIFQDLQTILPEK